MTVAVGGGKRGGGDGARAEVAVMVVAEVAIAGIQVSFFTRPNVLQHGWLGIPGGEQGSGVDVQPQNKLMPYRTRHTQPSPVVAVVAQTHEGGYGTHNKNTRADVRGVEV